MFRTFAFAAALIASPALADFKSDRIAVTISVPAEKAQWAQAHRELIAREILALAVEFGDVDSGADIGDGVRGSISRAGAAT